MTNTKKLSMPKKPEVLNKRKSSSRLNGFRKSSSGIIKIILSQTKHNNKEKVKTIPVKSLVSGWPNHFDSKSSDILAEF